MNDIRTVYVSIGNSDDKLTQREWSDFVREVNHEIHVSAAAGLIHGTWLSHADAPWQNACWCFDVISAEATQLRAELAILCGRYRQDSIAWAEATVGFLTPTG